MALPVEFTLVPRPSGTAEPAIAAFGHSASDLEWAGIGGIVSAMGDAQGIARRVASLGLVATHRVGDLPPLEAATRFQSLASSCAGPVSLRIVPDLTAEEARLEGHAAHWQRIEEYLVLLKRLWANGRGFDFEGRFYRVGTAEAAWAARHRAAEPFDPLIRIAGSRSGTALKTAARHADVFELMPGSPAETRTLIERARTAAAEFGRARQLRFALPVRIGADPGDDATAIHLAGAPSCVAVGLMRYADLGVSDFMVAGLDDPAALKAFAEGPALLLRNSLTRREGETGRQPRNARILWQRPEAGR